ncbi:MAG: HD domain-containing protein [Candidatus Falkowbacteria bacterium]|nr:HD domain-containing protein [Candidatus Falkowbacteria bacterium]
MILKPGENIGQNSETPENTEGFLVDSVIEDNNFLPETEEDKKKNEENRASFEARLEGLSRDEKWDVMRGYNLGKEAHRTQKRDSGERYFEHLRSVALILIDECQIKDPNLTIACLLHDSIEDSPIFGNSNLAYSAWKEESDYHLSKTFNKKVSELVIGLTKPKVDGVEIKNKKEAHDAYINNLLQGSPDTILLKMCDRLHNLRSLKNNTPEKRLKTIKETKEVYLPIFQEALLAYPNAGASLLEKINKEIEAVEQMD